jgi:entry exclusion lipoprotein TrbK
MKSRNHEMAALVLAVGALLVGCKDKPSVASPACADLEKVTDPVQKAELLKKCPRSGPAFKPSREKKW